MLLAVASQACYWTSQLHSSPGSWACGGQDRKETCSQKTHAAWTLQPLSLLGLSTGRKMAAASRSPLARVGEGGPLSFSAKSMQGPPKGTLLEMGTPTAAQIPSPMATTDALKGMRAGRQQAHAWPRPPNDTTPQRWFGPSIPYVHWEFPHHSTLLL